mgnify:FL=1
MVARVEARRAQYTPEAHFASRLPLMRWCMVLSRARVSSGARRMALALVTFAQMDGSGGITAGSALLGAIAGIGDRNARRYLAELRQSGFLSQDGAGRARSYTLSGYTAYPGKQITRVTPSPGLGDHPGIRVTPSPGRPGKQVTLQDGLKDGRKTSLGSPPAPEDGVVQPPTLKTPSTDPPKTNPTTDVTEAWEGAYAEVNQTPDCPPGCAFAERWGCREHGRGYPGWCAEDRQAAKLLGERRTGDQLYAGMMAYIAETAGGEYPATLAGFRRHAARIETKTAQRRTAPVQAARSAPATTMPDLVSARSIVEPPRPHSVDRTKMNT